MLAHIVKEDSTLFELEQAPKETSVFIQNCLWHMAMRVTDAVRRDLKLSRTSIDLSSSRVTGGQFQCDCGQYYDVPILQFCSTTMNPAAKERNEGGEEQIISPYHAYLSS